ncbi:MAG: hypothetical protein ACYTFW_23630 [Planctomycetota bacterium]|jgi:hypothetical protein
MVDSKAQLLARGVFPLTSKTVRDYNGFFSLKSKLEINKTAIYSCGFGGLARRDRIENDSRLWKHNQ